MKKTPFYTSLILSIAVLFSCNSNTATTETTLVADSSAAPLPTATAAPKTAESFIIEGHEVLNQSKADLNGDGFEDVILILANKKAEELASESGENVLRPLLILTGDATGSMSLAVRNDKVVLCSECGGVMGDPFDGLETKAGGFSVSFYGGSAQRWSRNLEFEYNKEQATWVLATDVSEYFSADNPEKGKKEDNKKAATPIKDFDVDALQ